MQYLLLIYETEPQPGDPPPPADVFAEVMAGYNAFTQDVRDRGIFLAGEALEPTSTATSVRLRDGRPVVTDGPFAETKEALGGFYLLECKDLDEAIELAAKIPAARTGTIEIRPIWDYQPPSVTG